MLDAVLVRIPAWSGLRTLGQSPAMKLTILMPFIGALILFNAQLVDFLKMTPMALFPKSGGDAEIPVWRLAVTYFGLLGLGCASFIFTLRCPADIKCVTELREFAAKEAQLTTVARSSYLAMEVLANFRANRIPDGDIPMTTADHGDPHTRRNMNGISFCFLTAWHQNSLTASQRLTTKILNFSIIRVTF
jgi:hypothetical protein